MKFIKLTKNYEKDEFTYVKVSEITAVEIHPFIGLTSVCREGSANSIVEETPEEVMRLIEVSGYDWWQRLIDDIYENLPPVLLIPIMSSLIVAMIAFVLFAPGLASLWAVNTIAGTTVLQITFLNCFAVTLLLNIFRLTLKDILKLKDR